ncbi:hypothetical protein OQJ62_11740 [Microbulbifer thermotolerans]|uniref:DUF6515 family protein n=1 Tax=Microbulbifer thermotolerans TaxID=252514 RepID=UPI002249A24E|nr:DUF6515 family protein [Microbulbifer thermotolerans]MCX2795593.1 hypothetical protein [Microbulbifer thermotolerans]
MKTIPTLTAIIATGLLLAAAPSLADDQHKWRGHREASGSALREAYQRERRKAHDERPDKSRHKKSKDHKGDKHHGDTKKYKRAYKKGYEHGYRDSRRRNYTHHHKPVHRPHYRPGYIHHKPRWRPAHYGYGYRWRQLPRSFVRISFGAAGFYFYSDGIFFRPHNQGYVVARPPIGAVVHSLPGTAVSVVVSGRNYYAAYDTYYLWDSAARGYRVVANPGFF